MTRTILFAFALVSLFASGCGPGRTAAATQTTPAAFNPGDSEEQAIAIVDQMLANIGTAEAWEAAKQIQWEVKYLENGQIKNWFIHAWDRWNGRHRFEMLDMQSYQEFIAKSGRKKFTVTMYDLFDRSHGFASHDRQKLGKDDRQRIMQTAYERWQHDSYQLAMLYKLKDPGVKLSYYGTDKEKGHNKDKCLPECEVVKVTFDKTVGEDTYFVFVNKDSKMPEIYAKNVKVGDKTGVLEYVISEWVEVGGLKFPTVFHNVGLAAEMFKLENIRIGSPDDNLYVPGFDAH